MSRTLQAKPIEYQRMPGVGVMLGRVWVDPNFTEWPCQPDEFTVYTDEIPDLIAQLQAVWVANQEAKLALPVEDLPVLPRPAMLEEDEDDGWGQHTERDMRTGPDGYSMVD